MIENVIHNIIQAEEKADTVVREAVKQSKEIVAKAKNDSAELLRATERALDSEQVRLKAEAEDSAAAVCAEVLEKSEKEAAQFIRSYENKTEEAQKAVFIKLLEKYGNR